jgi:hypothetical protein
MNGPDSISDPVARRLRCTESYPLARGSAWVWWRGRWVPLWWRGCWLDADWSMTWLLTWHAYCAWWLHFYVMRMSSLSGSATWVGSTGIRVGSTHPGEEDTWGASARVDRRLAGEWWRVRPCPTSDFDAVFTGGFVLASSTQWYGQNTILRTFIFEQKSNTT